MRKALLWLLIPAALLVGCGDNVRPGDDDDTPDGARPDAEVPDAEVPDAYYCAPFAEGALGGACTVNADCDSAPGAADGMCFKGIAGPSIFAPEGYCIVFEGGAACTVDADCGENARCVFSEALGHFCAPACCMFDTCPTNQACWDSFNGFPLDQAACTPGNANAADGDQCAGFYECNEFSGCTIDFEHPGGQCERYDCTVGDDTTCHGGVCIDYNDHPQLGTLCVSACATDADCRQAEGYVCYDPDPGSTTDQKYCRHPHVGDPCAEAADCGTGTWSCQAFPDGYCTQVGCQTLGSSGECTPLSICADMGAENMCLDRCPTPGQTTGCRTGYTCIDTNPDPAVVQGGCAPIP